jgi:beta-barrel assembly-enhancing protease
MSMASSYGGGTGHEGQGERWLGRYSDPATAGSVVATLRFDPRGLMIEGLPDGHPPVLWTWTSLHTDTPVQKRSGEAIISSDTMPGATLYVDDHDFVHRLCEHAPHITTSAHRLRWARPVLLAAAVIGIAGAAVWFANVKPARAIAQLMPQSAREAFGEKVVSYLAGKHHVCVAPAGRAALETIFSRLIPAPEERKKFTIVAVDWGLVNAFAAPGGRIVVTRGLIRASKTPEEVAGVIAHELGHGIELHPEAGIVRALGISTLIDVMLGGSSGALGGLTGMLIQTGYAREDERSADHQALRLMRSAGVSQSGLADFFERIAQRELPGLKPKSDGEGDSTDAKGSATLGGALDLLRTHPQPGERAAYVRTTPIYPTRPVLRERAWNDLKQICSVKEKPGSH